MAARGLYIHIPYCVSKCGYCDFTSYTNQWETVDAYIEALSIEASRYAGCAADTVYIGGGTPSLLTEKQMASLFKKIYRDFNVAKKAEITVEANPGTIDKNKLRAYLKAGINRLSLGVQSFCSGDLGVCGRIHGVNENIEAFRIARDAGFSNISMDIMFGLPDQTMADIVSTLNTVFKLSPEHISFYGLKIEEGTPFFLQGRSS